MSYEGYTNYFCSNGHYLGSMDCYDGSEFEDCFCGATVTFTEQVDQTNGCDSDCMNDSCYAHSQVLQKQIRVDKKNCHCKQGKIIVTKDYATGEKIEIDCPKCQGTYKLDVPVYDVSEIDYRKGN